MQPRRETEEPEDRSAVLDRIAHIIFKPVIKAEEGQHVLDEALPDSEDQPEPTRRGSEERP